MVGGLNNYFMRNKRCNEELIWGKKFGDKLKRLIHIREMTQGRFAAELGVHEVTLSRYITGTCVPSPYRIQQIANILGCDVNYLYDVEN